MKIREADRDPAAPKSLLYTQVPSQVALRFQPEVVAENLVLTARRTEPRRDAGMQVRIGFRNQIAAGKPIGPNVAELIEVIVATARNQVQILERADAGLKENRGLLGMIADESRLRSKRLRNKRTFLSGVDPAVEKTLRST